MLNTVLGNISDLVTLVLGAMGNVVQLWPVAIMVGFLVLGVGAAAIKKLAGARKRRRAK